MSHDHTEPGGRGGGPVPQPCACCAALAQVRMPWLQDPSLYNKQAPPPPAQEEHIEPEKEKTVFFSFPGLKKHKPKSGKSKSARPQAVASIDGKSDADDDTDESGEWQDPDLSVPKVKRIWSGIDGLAICVFGLLVPSFVFFASIASAPKRLTLVLLNHPLETSLELALLLAIPLANFFAWSHLCKGKSTFPRLLTIALGSSVGTSLVVAGLSGGGMFAGSADMAAAIGTDFTAGFTWIAILSLLAGCVSSYLIHRQRKLWELPAGRLRVTLQAITGVVLSLLAFAGCEYRPWITRMAEQMAVSASPKERQEGLANLRQLDAERGLRMECSDARAAGLAGLYFPVKQTKLHQLYFSLTGTPYSCHDLNTTDLSSLPDDYLSRHVVGDRIPGLSLTRSNLSGPVHPNTLSSSLSWTFVIKNESSSQQEARAEIGLPPGAAITGLTLWRRGEPTDAAFVATGQIDGVTTETASHDSPAMVTDLGHGRYLMHCYPVMPDEELKVRVSMVVPLKPETSSQASLVMPQLIATNFELNGEHLLRLHSDLKLTSQEKTLSQGLSPSGARTLSGTLTARQLEGSAILVSSARPATLKPVAVLDKLATKMRQQDLKYKEEQKRLAEARNNNNEMGEVIVMVDGAKAKDQLDEIQKLVARKKANHKPVIKTVPPVYVSESIEKVAAPAPKHLVIVIDGSAKMQENIAEITKALEKLPKNIPTSVMIASQEHPELMQAHPLARVLSGLNKTDFVGGQDNLQAVVKASELAGETKGGAVLWIHGPQPVLNEEIYIMSPYISTPSFYEVQVGTGTDAFEFFKNHTEIGPFVQVPKSGGAVSHDLDEFFAKWTPDSNAFVVSYEKSDKAPQDFITPTDDEATELLLLNAADQCNRLLAKRQLKKAARIALSYGLVSSVSSALIGDNTNLDASDADEDDEEAGSTRRALQSLAQHPVLQGATNGTIGPQGDFSTVVCGVNTAGTVRVNNLANLEALLNIFANLGEIGCGVAGLILVLHGFFNKATVMLGKEIELGPAGRITIGGALIVIGLVLPGMINWFVASARDANLFS